jgi:hypothetical protein
VIHTNPKATGIALFSTLLRMNGAGKVTEVHCREWTKDALYLSCRRVEVCYLLRRPKVKFTPPTYLKLCWVPL